MGYQGYLCRRVQARRRPIRSASPADSDPGIGFPPRLGLDFPPTPARRPPATIGSEIKPPRSLPLTLAPAVLIVAALLAACGSDDSGGGGTTGASEAGSDEFLAAVDATCVEHAVAVNELSERHGIPQRFSQNAPYDQARAEAAVDQAQAAAAIEPPQEVTADYEAYVASLESYADVYQENADLAAAGDKDAWEASTADRRELGSEQIELAEALGLQACARKLPAAAEAAVMEVAERVLTGADPERSCTEDLTATFIEDRLGNEERCVRLLGRLGPDGASLEFLFFTGVDEVLASANVNYTASADREAQYLIYDFIWDEGTEAWKMDSSFVAGPAEPSPSGDPGGSA